MIHEVDELIRSMIREGVLSGSDIEVAFDAPTREWAARRNTPTISAYLYDIREDISRRHRGMVNVHGEQGMVLKRRQPPRWFRLSYLVTAWTKRPEDEHRLLSAVMMTMLPQELLPPSALTGPLAELKLSVPVSVAVPPIEARSLADIWSALGGELKPSLDVVVTAPFPVSPEYKVGPPVLEGHVRVRGRLEEGQDSGERTHGARHFREVSATSSALRRVGGPGRSGPPPAAASGGASAAADGPGAGPAAGEGAGEGPEQHGRRSGKREGGAR